MAYTRLPNYTKMVVGEHKIQTVVVVVVVVSTSAHTLLLWDKSAGPNILKHKYHYVAS